MTDLLREAMKGWRTAPGSEDPPLKFETAGDRFIFVGYSPDEIAQILASLREYMQATIDIAEQARNIQTSGDAVRYRPENDVMSTFDDDV
jgi:hypothetical protein